jgi:hypothetical protein
LPFRYRLKLYALFIIGENETALYIGSMIITTGINVAKSKFLLKIA